MILPTLLESFSATYIEAMFHGKTILTSDLDFARDVCGEAAFYFDPLNPQSIGGGDGLRFSEGRDQGAKASGREENGSRGCGLAAKCSERIRSY